MDIDLTALRRQAKLLRKAYRGADADAEVRVRAVLGAKPAAAHADFLHVVAVEAGAASWPRLKFAAETAAMSRADRAQRLKMALYFGQNWVVEALLAEDPDLPRDRLDLQIALYDLPAVEAAIARDPTVATRAIGPRVPLLHLAFSQYLHMAPERAPAMLRIADLLLAAGADVNLGFAPDPDAPHRLSPLYGALGHARNLALGEWLLRHGANPDDDESLYHATEFGDARALRLLLAHGANPDGTNALNRALDFDDLEMVTMLLKAGAQTAEALPLHPSGEPMTSVPALHQAARRWCGAPVVRALLDHGADPALRWQGLTAHAVARVYGNDAAAEALAQAGHAEPLPPTVAALAACARGSAPDARLSSQDLAPELRLLPCRIAARPERLAHLRALLLAGLDPETRDEMDLTPLHVAGWEGLPEQVAYLLEFAPDLARENAYGGDALGTVIHGAEFCPARRSRDHVTCARLLLKAGAVLRPREIAETGSAAMAAFLEDWSAEMD
ncbi:MAG: ankyrin repeat domain-containing protein [Pseudomonadota bacterium]